MENQETITKPKFRTIKTNIQNIKVETDRAYKIKVEGEKQFYWMPKSLCRVNNKTWELTVIFPIGFSVTYFKEGRKGNR